MLCDRCGEREATHHDTVVSGGQVHETHLCEECAQQMGVSPQPAGSVSEWLANFVLSPPKAAGSDPRSPVGLRCEHCGLTFSQFKKSGLMGCPGCYEAFEHKLVPLLERAHEGGDRHIGKSPRRGLSSGRMQGKIDTSAVEAAHARADRIEMLRRELAEAVRTEAYERAAKIRDELASLTRPESQAKREDAR